MNIIQSLLLLTVLLFSSCEKESESQEGSPSFPSQKATPVARAVSIQLNETESVGSGIWYTDSQGEFLVTARLNFKGSGTYSACTTDNGQIMVKHINYVDENEASELCVCLFGPHPVVLYSQPTSSMLRVLKHKVLAKAPTDGIRLLTAKKMMNPVSKKTYDSVAEWHGLPQRVECIDTGKDALPNGTNLISPDEDDMLWVICEEYIEPFGNTLEGKYSIPRDGRMLCLCFGQYWTEIHKVRENLVANP